MLVVSCCVCGAVLIKSKHSYSEIKCKKCGTTQNIYVRNGIVMISKYEDSEVFNKIVSYIESA